MTIDHNEWLHQIALSIFLRAFINYSAGPQWCCCGCFNRTLLGNRAVWIRVFQPIAVESNLSLKHTMNFMHWSTNTSITFPVQYLPSGKDANIHYNFCLLLSNCLRLNGCERLARFFLLAEFYIPRFRLKLLFFFLSLLLFVCLWEFCWRVSIETGFHWGLFEGMAQSFWYPDVLLHKRNVDREMWYIARGRGCVYKLIDEIDSSAVLKSLVESDWLAIQAGDALQHLVLSIPLQSSY